MARRVIAADLGLDLEDIAFILQGSFHIDMDLCIAPNGNVFLDNSIHPHILSAIQLELERINCKVFLVPGVHTREKEGKVIKAINFMNGVFVPTPSGPLYITNGIGEEDEESIRARDLFVQTMAEVYPELTIQFLEETQNFLTQGDGGIHCLTWKGQTQLLVNTNITKNLVSNRCERSRRWLASTSKFSLTFGIFGILLQKMCHVHENIFNRELILNKCRCIFGDLLCFLIVCSCPFNFF